MSLIDELYLQPARYSGIISVPTRPYRVNQHQHTVLHSLSYPYYCM